MSRRRCYPLVLFCTLAACGGGGGGTGSPPPGTGSNPTPSAAPTTAHSGGATSFAVTSVPAGLGVVETTHASSQTFTTPVTIEPALSNFATTISIAPSNGAAAYAVTVDQTEAGSAQVLYNQHADTSGSIGSISQTPLVRRSIVVQRSDAEGVLRIPVESSANRPAYSDADLIVHYRQNAQIEALERRLGVARAYALRRDMAGNMARVVDVPQGKAIEAFARQLRASSDVVSVERDALYYKQSSTPVTPDDTHYNSYDQWDMFDIGMPHAWGYTEGSPSVSIAMIDTGVDTTSPEFSGAKITFAESVLAGQVTTGLAAVGDTDGHGTDTAGIASDNTNNAFGFAGVGFNGGLAIFKVFPNDTAANKYASTAQESDVTLAIDNAVAAGAKVINLSLGTCQIHGPDSTQQAAVENAIAHGVVVVAAAGNERSGISTDASCAGGSSTVDYPAAYPGVISVGATSLDDSADPMNPATAVEKVAGYSNSGPGLSIVAPGGDPTAADQSSTGTPDVLHWVLNEYSTTVADPNEQCSNKSDCSALFAGTSQASPHVAGVAALMLAKNPNLTPAAIKQILISTADDIADPNQGNGRLDAYRALASVSGDSNPPAAPAYTNFVAIAYVPSGTNRPQIVDVTYPAGVPVAHDGSFRIADVPASTASYKIGVWYDANGDGVVDAGDYFGNSQSCTPAQPCASAAGIVAAPVPTGFVLP